jgi:serine/threonine protein kinase
MAPEVVKNQEYDEKADVFSFAMVMYNLFHRTIPSNLLNINGDAPDAVENYGKEVAQGYRPPIGKSYPINDTLKTLIEQCWAENPGERPSMKAVLQVLSQLQTDGAMSAQASGGCCSLM